MYIYIYIYTHTHTYMFTPRLPDAEGLPSGHLAAGPQKRQSISHRGHLATLTHST